MSLLTLIILTLCKHLKSLEYERNLTVHHPKHSGIELSPNPQSVNTSNGIWHINPTSQDSYDLELILEHEWMFNPSTQSNLTLTLDGFTSNASIEDGEFIIVFSVGNTQYFAVVIRLDTGRNTWKYYPKITPDSTSFIITNDVMNEIIAGGPDSRNRWLRVSNSTNTNDRWADIKPFHKDPLQWPFTIKLINDPITDTLLYKCILHNKILEVKYSKAFNTDEKINIYIMNDATDNKPFDISWMFVQYADNETLNISTTTSEPTTTETTVINSGTNINATLHDFNVSNVTNTSITSTVNMYTTNIAIIKETVPEHSSIMPQKNAIGAMIGIVIIVVFITVCIVVMIFLYWKKKEEQNDPNSLNRSEYHQPEVNMSKTEIKDTLAKKRRESQQFAENNMLKKRKVSEAGQRTQSIVSIDDSGSDDETNTYEDEEDNKFTED